MISPSMFRSVASGLMIESVRSVATTVPRDVFESRGLIAVAHDSGKEARSAKTRRHDPENKAVRANIDQSNVKPFAATAPARSAANSSPHAP
jgi:hypothetical protein